MKSVLKPINVINLAEAAYTTFVESGATGTAAVSTTTEETRVDAHVRVSVLVEVTPLQRNPFEQLGEMVTGRQCTCGECDDDDDGSDLQ
jgi:hypothetical protein